MRTIPTVFRCHYCKWTMSMPIGDVPFLPVVDRITVGRTLKTTYKYRPACPACQPRAQACAPPPHRAEEP